MEASCGKCSFPIHVEKAGAPATCPACGFRGIASYDETRPWLYGLLGAIAVLGLVAASKEGSDDKGITRS